MLFRTRGVLRTHAIGKDAFGGDLPVIWLCALLLTSDLGLAAVNPGSDVSSAEYSDNSDSGADGAAESASQGAGAQRRATRRSDDIPPAPALQRKLAVLRKRYLPSRTPTFRVSDSDLTAQLQRAAKAGDARSAWDLAVWHVQLGFPSRAFVQTRSWDTEPRNRFWMARAREALQGAAPGTAEKMLGLLREPMPRQLIHERESLLALSLMQQERYVKAAQVLESSRGFPRNNLFDYYNYALSLLAQNRVPEGLALLDEMGDVPAEDESVITLLDRANLAIAWTWLAQDQGGTARFYFKRVGLNGMHASVALLGLGWAELAPDGAQQKVNFKRRLHCADLQAPPKSVTLFLFSSHAGCSPREKPAVFKFYHRFGYESGAQGAARFRAALTPWRELSLRGTHDSAVQEALLAIGYAYEQLEDYRQAVGAYQHAVQRYASELTRLKEFSDALRAPNANPITAIKQLARRGEFGTLRSSHQYVQMAADLRTLDAAQRIVANERKQFDRATASEQQREITTELRAAVLARLRKAVADDVETRTQRLAAYLLRARIALAALYEQGAVQRDG